MSACAGQDLTVIDEGMQFPGWMLYVNGDDAHDDGTGKCDSAIDRWSAKTFVEITASLRFSIVTGTLPSGHKTLEGAGKLLTLVDPIANRMAARHSWSKAIYFQINNLFTVSRLAGLFLTAAPDRLVSVSNVVPSGSIITTRNPTAGSVDHSVGYVRSAVGFHHLVHSFDSTTGLVTVYLDGVNKGTVAIAAGQDPTALDNIELGGGTHVCRFHQWAFYDAALTPAQVAISYSTMTSLAT